jgi:AraC-like DNA-binding protein
MNAALRIPPSEVKAPTQRAGTAEAYAVAVERVLRHMRGNLAEPLDLDALARIAAISKFHFVRVFDQLTGTTPHHFLACLRMQRAKELLLQSERAITDICFDVGYNSLGSFSKTFSDLVGVSPQEFRRFPKRLKPMQFARAVWHFLASDQSVRGARARRLGRGAGATARVHLCRCVHAWCAAGGAILGHRDAAGGEIPDSQTGTGGVSSAGGFHPADGRPHYDRHHASH